MRFQGCHYVDHLGIFGDLSYTVLTSIFKLIHGFDLIFLMQTNFLFFLAPLANLWLLF